MLVSQQHQQDLEALDVTNDLNDVSIVVKIV